MYNASAHSTGVCNNRSPRGIVARRDNLLAGEIAHRSGLPVTTVPRTAFDLARRGPRRRAIADVDALANATRLPGDEVLAIANRHPRLRGLRRLASVLDSVDDGAQSPQETYLRLSLIDAGFPRLQTQGWPDIMVAVEDDGEQHRTDRPRYFSDVVRLEYLTSVGWIVIRVLADHRPTEVIDRVHRAWDVRRGRIAG